LKLVEIFKRFNDENGWFGKMHLLVFGNLLQLPPVSDGPVFTPVLTETLNMRQKDDDNYKKNSCQFASRHFE